MAMNADLLFVCLALAALGLVLLAVVFRTLLRTARSGWLALVLGGTYRSTPNMCRTSPYALLACYVLLPQ